MEKDSINRQPEPRINEQIRFRELRLIDEDGTQLGVKSLYEAMSLAQARGKDLIELAPNANPPVAKIGDFSKFRYEREKKMKESRKHHKAGTLKEIRIRPRISGHDLETKVNHADQFLEGKFKVRFTVVFRGRENEHLELGKGLLVKVQELLDGKFIIEQTPKQEGNRISILLAPKK